MRVIIRAMLHYIFSGVHSQLGDRSCGCLVGLLVYDRVVLIYKSFYILSTTFLVFVYNILLKFLLDKI